MIYLTSLAARIQTCMRDLIDQSDDLFDQSDDPFDQSDDLFDQSLFDQSDDLFDQSKHACVSSTSTNLHSTGGGV
jgi:hypothetical protein